MSVNKSRQFFFIVSKLSLHQNIKNKEKEREINSEDYKITLFNTRSQEIYN
jgi:hypothetical protein